MSSPVIEIRDGSFGYDGHVAIAGVTMTVAAGEALALIGSNGSGKSTILRSIAGLLDPITGTLEFSGAPRTNDTAMLIGYLPQAETYDASFPVTLRQAVEMGRYRRLRWWRRMRQVDRVAVSAALQVTDLTDVSDTVFSNLSGGQQKRAILARALANQPKILLLDEPFNGLDKPNRDSLTRTLIRLKNSGAAVVLTTHDLDLARDVCDTAALLNEGRVEAFGPVAETLTMKNLGRVFPSIEIDSNASTVILSSHHGH
jgi:manganese/iron transport system ATP-binding protein